MEVFHRFLCTSQPCCFRKPFRRWRSRKLLLFSRYFRCCCHLFLDFKFQDFLLIRTALHIQADFGGSCSHCHNLGWTLSQQKNHWSVLSERRHPGHGIIAVSPLENNRQAVSLFQVFLGNTDERRKIFFLLASGTFGSLFDIFIRFS